MSEVKFYRCNHCGRIEFTVVEGGCEPSCCGEKMELLSANTTDAATEKHVPVIVRDGHAVTVKVGSVAHPMAEDHYIQFIALVADNKVSIAFLKPGEAPEAKFCAGDAEHVEAYEYCNKHGLWKAEA